MLARAAPRGRRKELDRRDGGRCDERLVLRRSSEHPREEVRPSETDAEAHGDEREAHRGELQERAVARTRNEDGECTHAAEHQRWRDPQDAGDTPLVAPALEIERGSNLRP